uniref:Chloride channel protein n=1 Tax=Peronospora matthiolae TaxID=2874970 RepID=A0AAV1VD37_9STRA
MTSNSRRPCSSSVSYRAGSILRPRLDQTHSTNNGEFRRRSSSPQVCSLQRRADSVMERIMNPQLDRKSPSHGRRYWPRPTRSELPASFDIVLSTASPRYTTQLSTGEKDQSTYAKSLAFDEGLHSVYVADYPRGLRGLFVLVQSPLLLVAIGIFAGSVGLVVDMWSAEIARYYQWVGDHGFGLFVASALFAGGFSALLTQCVCPQAAGSGLPFMKVAISGLSIGKEGPLVMISCVLFGVEVTSHFYLVRTLPRSFFAAIVGALIVGFGAANSRYGLFGNRSIAINADTNAVKGSGDLLCADLCLFALMGIFCGLAGAFFNYTLSILVRARDRFFQPSLSSSPRVAWWNALGKRLGLVLAVTLLSCWLEFYGDSAWFMLHGSPRRILDELFSKHKRIFASDSARKSTTEQSLLLSRSLLTFLPLKCVLTLISILLPVPAGLFTPTFVIGGIFGRLVGEVVRAFDFMSTSYEPFEFAIIGAGAFSSGVTHAISTAVMIMEISHTDGLNLPVSVATLAAYFTAKRFTENVYDVLIVTSNLPRLKKLPKAAYDISAWEVMKDVAEMGVLSADSTYEDALVLLQRSDMDLVFPIVDSLENRFLLATVTRSRLADAVSLCQRQSSMLCPLTTEDLRQPVETSETSSLLLSTSQSASSPIAKTTGDSSGSRAVARGSYGAISSIPRDDNSGRSFDDTVVDGLDELNVHSLRTPIHFAFCRGGKILDWVTNEVCHPSELTVFIDPSPVQLMEMTPMRRVDMLFRMLKLNNVFVARSGKLRGVISLERMMTFLGTTTPYRAPGLLRTLRSLFVRSNGSRPHE